MNISVIKIVIALDPTTYVLHLNMLRRDEFTHPHRIELP